MSTVVWWLDSVTVLYTVGRRTYDQEIVGSTPGRVAIKWLLYLDV